MPPTRETLSWRSSRCGSRSFVKRNIALTTERPVWIASGKKSSHKLFTFYGPENRREGSMQS